MVPSPERAVRFGPFELRSSQRLLLENGTPVRLGGRALDLLCALVERAGEVVGRDELVGLVWGNTVVEDTSLRVHVASLRKALGDGLDERRYIANVVGRGYSFVGRLEPSRPATPAAPLARHAPALPARLSRVIGRESETMALSLRLAQHRFVTVVGHGGMGKTTVALAVARDLLAGYADGAHFVDLAPVTDAKLVPAALAAALGIDADAADVLDAVLGSLRHQRSLLVLDNCEHVIHAAAELSEAVLKNAPGVHLIATSREPLDADGEWVHRLAALGTPLSDEALTVKQALAFPAVQLFVERAIAGSDTFVLCDENLSLVRHLCRRLDGMPLALELAASRMESLGVGGLVASLDDMFRILTRGRRTVLPRHRTLRALLDWSHDLLAADERTVLRRLAVFPAGFSLAAATALAQSDGLGPQTVMECVWSLAAKSLVAVRKSSDPACFVLLHVTRVYALEKLAQSGEREATGRRHEDLHLATIHTVSRQSARHSADDPTTAGGTRGLSASSQESSCRDRRP